MSCFLIFAQVVREKYGALEYIDLIPDGGKTPVNLENRCDDQNPLFFKPLIPKSK